MTALILYIKRFAVNSFHDTLNFIDQHISFT